MENNLKRQSETELESEVYKRSKTDPREQEQEQDVMGKWIKECQGLGAKFLKPEFSSLPRMTKQMSEHETDLADFYIGEKGILEKDQTLFADICPIPIAHEMARYWILYAEKPKYYYSKEQSILFFVLEDYIGRKDEKRRSRILIRLMEIANYYQSPDDNKKYKHHNSLISVPGFACIILAAMDYTNISLIPIDSHPMLIERRNIKDRYGFDTLVQGSLFPGKELITDDCLLQATDLMKANSVQRYNNLLVERYEGDDEKNIYYKPSKLSIRKVENSISYITY